MLLPRLSDLSAAYVLGSDDAHQPFLQGWSTFLVDMDGFLVKPGSLSCDVQAVF
jgi:hypothetical protein